MITKEMTMAQAVLDHPKLLPLFTRFNIRLGFGERLVEEVCRASGINTDFFLEIANAYLDAEYIPHEDFSHFPLEAMVEYLRATHSYYLDLALPCIEKKIHRLLEQSKLSDKEVALVSGFFNDYKQDFLTHISQEEKEIMPYILELEQQSMKPRPDDGFILRLKSYSIRTFAMEHDRLEYSLENLYKLIIKYLPPFEDQELCIQVLGDLAELVKDLVDHGNMEDKVLIPRVYDLEQELLRKARST